MWCADGAKPEPCVSCGGCPKWCQRWKCEEEWCAHSSKKPEACDVCACPDWCVGWKCDGSLWCADGRVPEDCVPCVKVAKSDTKPSGEAFGPVPAAGPEAAGWAVEQVSGVAPSVSVGPGPVGVLTITGDTRAYLVNDYQAKEWADRRYVRFDLQKAPLELSVDLSGVPCGCLACLYLVAM